RCGLEVAMNNDRSSKVVPYVVICEAHPAEAFAVVHARCAADAVREFLLTRRGLLPGTRVSAYRHDASFRWKPEFHLDGIPSEESVGHSGGADHNMSFGMTKATNRASS